MTGAAAISLDLIDPLRCSVGYGQMGRGGDLGYENQRVLVGGRAYASALSTHAPARLVYDLGGHYGRLTTLVGLNDDVPRGSSHANFSVLADGRVVAEALRVGAGEVPVAITADLRGANLLELTVSTSVWSHCHAVWLNPRLESDGAPAPAQADAMLVDPLARAEIPLPTSDQIADRCIATVVSPGFERWGDDLLGSIVAYGNCPETQLVVLALDGDAGCAALAAKYGARYVRCRSLRRLGPGSKAILYSIARVAPAEKYVCLDADTLVLQDLEPLFGAIDAVPAGTVLAAREGNGRGLANLGHALDLAYGGGVPPFFDRAGPLARYPLVVNDGVFAGDRGALLTLDGEIRSMPGVVEWVDEHAGVGWRNQFVFNVALARLDALAELDATWNLQLHTQEVHSDGTILRPGARWQGRPVRVLHFAGWGKQKVPDLRERCAAVDDPVVGRAPGDAYGAFLRVLRAWLGRVGLGALTWSFYGTSDGQGARVSDTSTFPLLATLHYLVRSNGCARVLETGTARGVSAACLASAVAHRPGAHVVSFDPEPHSGCAEFWSELPEAMHECIEQRRVDSIEGMRAALAVGETYQAALLDSVHTEAHLWAELDLAVQLVCEGGLILCHDPTLPGATVEGALQRLERAGYGVTRLWTAGDGVPEDDRLGLAIVENRRRSDALGTSAEDVFASAPDRRSASPIPLASGG